MGVGVCVHVCECASVHVSSQTNLECFESFTSIL